MEIRLKIFDITVVALAFLFSGVLIGFMLAGETGLAFGFTIIGMVLFPALTIILKRRYKVLTAKQIKSIPFAKRNLN